MIADMAKAGVDYHALLDTYIRAINVVTVDRPDDLIISVHMCRGNFKVHLSLIALVMTLTVNVYRVAFISQRVGTAELR